MSIANDISFYEQHLYSDVETLEAAGIPERQQVRLKRLRDIHAYWLNFPDKHDLDIVVKLSREYGVSQSQAYQDVRIVKLILGNMSKASKDFHRYRFIQMIEETFEMAKKNKDAKAMASATAAYGKYTMLDKEDLVDKGYDRIQIQPFIPTDDPASVGLKPIPDLRRRVAQLLKKYSTDIETVEPERADFGMDFSPSDIEEVEEKS